MSYEMRGSIRAETWLYETLAALMVTEGYTGQRVFKGEAPPEAPTPYIAYSRVSAIDSGVIGGPGTQWQTLGYQWVVVDRGADQTTIEDLSEAIDEALCTADTSVIVDGYEIETERAGEIPTDPPREDGDEYIWFGANLMIWTTKVETP